MFNFKRPIRIRMKYNLLVIDDEIDICETIKEVVSVAVDQVFVATSAVAALEAVDKNQIHLIISDITMPGMNGLDLLKTLRAKRFKYPVIFVSASDSEDSLVKALEYGAADFIAKPFESDELLALVKRTLATVSVLAA